MESHLFFSQLVLVALIWLFIILHLPWPQRAVPVPGAPAQPPPLKSKRPRSNEPTPFEGLTHQPHCARCERETASLRASRPVIPAPTPRGGKHRVMFGPQLAIEQILAACGWTSTTAFVERLNLDLRQRVAAIGRRVNTRCQGEAGVQDQLVLFQV